MVRNLLSLKCQRARERQFVCPELPLPEGHRVTSMTCHGHQLPTCVPSVAGRVSYIPALPCCPWGSCTEQMSLPQLRTQGCWSLRLDSDLVADATCLESPWMDDACASLSASPARGHSPSMARAGLQWLLPASCVTQGRKCHQCSPQPLPGPAQGIWGLSPEVRNLTPKECPELFFWDKTPQLDQIPNVR